MLRIAPTNVALGVIVINNDFAIKCATKDYGAIVDPALPSTHFFL